MISCSEFTGVPLRILLDMAASTPARALRARRGRRRLLDDAHHPDGTGRVGRGAGRLRPERRDAAPENGYPLRLVVPGVQGVSWVKYLRRIEVGDKPYGAKDEAIHYVDLMPGGQHRQYTSTQEVKSVVTTPSGGQVLLDRGFYNISGLAWSGAARSRGSTCRSTAGATGAARIEGPVMAKCLTRFNIDWVWDGKPAIVRAAPPTRPATCSPPTARTARCAARARSITTTPSSRGWCRKAGGEECPALVSLVLLAVWRLASAGQRLRADGPFPASAARPRRANGGLGHRRAPRLQGPAQGPGLR